MQALFRMVELTSGNIEIDGLDIANMGLKDLRSNVGISKCHDRADEAQC